MKCLYDKHIKIKVSRRHMDDGADIRAIDVHTEEEVHLILTKRKTKKLIKQLESTIGK